MQKINHPVFIIPVVCLILGSTTAGAATISATAETNVNALVTTDIDNGPVSALAEAADPGGEAVAVSAVDETGRLSTSAAFSGANGTFATITAEAAWSETFSAVAGTTATFDFFIPGGAIGFEANNVGPLEGGYSIQIDFNGTPVFVATGNVVTTNNTPEGPGDVSLTQTGTIIGSSFANNISVNIFSSPGAGYIFEPFAGSLNLVASGGDNTITYTMTVFVDGLIGETSALASIGDPLDLSQIPAIVLEVDAGPLPQNVDIDIKPGSDPNSVNPRSKGVIPVAVLGSADFDATQVDPAAVTFGPNAATPAHDGHIEDVDEDGFMDALFHFRTQETGIVCGDSELTLSGELFDGTLISGSDTVSTVGCKKTNPKTGDATDDMANAGSLSGWLLLGLGMLGLFRLRRSNRRIE